MLRFFLFVLTISKSLAFGRNHVLVHAVPQRSRAIHRLSDVDQNNAVMDGDGPRQIPVLFENDSILAIDKPGGISHHDSENEVGILTVVRQCQAAGSLEFTGRVFGVHRLDRATSGILLLAKNQETASKLARAFREGRVVKYYVGVSTKKPKSRKQGWIKGNMVRGRRKSWYLRRGHASSSNHWALTRFFTASLSRLSQTDGVGPLDSGIPRTCLLLKPITGRSHQLRVAAKSIGLPLIGDPIYRDGTDSTAGLATRTCLHATAVHVSLGSDEEPVTVWSPPPYQHLWHGEQEKIIAFRAILLDLFEQHCDCDEIKQYARTVRV